MEVSTMLLVAILVLAVLALFKGSGSDTARLRSIERKLDLTLKQLGVDPNEGFDEQIKQLVQSGRKIEAIKLYRQQTGVGLKEAKENIERNYGR
jgi:ribosomal protein L7/L12